MNRYDVIVLGARGSGKTTFLSSMYHRLSSQEESTRYFLHLPQAQKKLLIDKFIEMADTSCPNSDWPAATRATEVLEYNFTCSVRGPTHEAHDVFQFNYWDYAGGLLLDPTTGEAFQELEAKFPNAHALLVLLDGIKVLAHIKGEGPKRHSLVTDLAFVYQEIEKNRHPVHFVITKWDQIEGHFSFKTVRDRLLAIPKFRQLVEQRAKQHVPIRVIPVSSVGMNFAKAHVDRDGYITMAKTPGAVPHPFFVEMPLACVIPDKLCAELSQLKENEDALRAETTTVAPSYNLFDWIGQLFAGAIDRIQHRLPEELRFAEGVLKRLAEVSLSGARRKDADAEMLTQQRRESIERTLQIVIDRHTAVEHVINNFTELVKQLETRFPESVLDESCLK